MSDGTNTENRWSTSQSSIDGRQATTCANMKAAGITIYAVQVETSGGADQAVMKNCASDANKFKKISDATQLTQVFADIATQISKLRLTN
jgi:hypothetical protein